MDVSFSQPSRPSAAATGGGSTIQVVVRLRPMNESEKKDGTLPVVTAKTAERSVTVIKGKGRKQLKSSYSFDNVFTAFSTQEEVFDATVKPVIADVMRGFESTVFAYGQTGTGKTHTMEGSLQSPELHGVIPRSAQAIFEHLKQPRYSSERVTCSYLEIYNEELRDLLVDGGGHGVNATSSFSPSRSSQVKLDIMEGKNGPFCRGLTEQRVFSASDVLSLMQKAQHSRMIGETRMNKVSSRSHCLFTIQVHGKIALCHGDGEMAFSGKLHLCDLAGSECAKSAGNEKGAPDAVARERERMNINRSLLTLGRVITVLKEKSLSKNSIARIPYRDSKLTRVLQESLGGRCKTIIIATLSPSITAIEESSSTLNYAHSANGIVNKPVSSSLIALSDNMPSNNSDSKSSAPTVESWQAMEMRLDYMQTQVDEAQAALARKHLQQQEIQDRAEKAEAELLESQQKLYDAHVEIKTLKGVVEDETSKRKDTERELNETQTHLKKTEAILKATQATETSLTSEARALIGKLEEVVSERNDMHALVVSQRNIESQLRQATRQFQEAALVVLNDIDSSFTNLVANIKTGQADIVKIVTVNHEVGRHSVSETQKLLSNIAKHVSCMTDNIQLQLVGQSGIIPTVEAGSTSVLSMMHSANDEFGTGEKSLEESHDAMRERLKQCTQTLEKRASSMETSTSQALQSFESSVIESRNTITQLVTRMKTSLSNLADAKAKKVKTLSSFIGHWRDQSLANSETVLNASTSSSISLKKSIDEFEKGMHLHEDIKKPLENQCAFLGSTGVGHVQMIGEQTSLLKAHRQKMAESHDMQSKLCNEVMQSIMSGMQSLVSSEIDKLAKTQMNHFQVLDRGGISLASTNEKITQSAKQVVENMTQTNQIVSEKASIVCNNDLKVSEVMKSTQNTLEQMMFSSSTHHELTSDFAFKSRKALSELSQLDEHNSEVIRMAEQDGKVTSAALLNNVLHPMSSEVKKILQTSLETMSHVNDDVISTTNRDLDNFAESRKPIATEISKKLKNASFHILDMTEHITSMAKAQHDVAEKLGNETLAASNKHEKESVPYYYAELDSGKEKLVSSMTHLIESCSHVASEGMSQGSTAKQSVEDFAQSKMHCTKPVDSVPPKKECKFSHSLSSTPGEDEILKGMDIDDTASCKDSVASSAASAAHVAESFIQIDPDTSQESQDDDEGKRKSAGSISSHPSPRLKFRDINANHGDNSSSKPRKHHRYATSLPSASRKNKCPSGQSTSKQIRKRMKR